MRSLNLQISLITNHQSRDVKIEDVICRSDMQKQSLVCCGASCTPALSCGQNWSLLNMNKPIDYFQALNLFVSVFTCMWMVQGYRETAKKRTSTKVWTKWSDDTLLCATVGRNWKSYSDQFIWCVERCGKIFNFAESDEIRFPDVLIWDLCTYTPRAVITAKCHLNEVINKMSEYTLYF